MNSSNAKFIHNKMQIHNKENPNDVFILVEVISMHSFNKEWIINNSKPNPNIRIMSIDYFYEIVTDIHDAFIQLINQLQISLKNVLNKFPQIKQNSKDTVLEELKSIDEDILKTLYKITFESYNGFDYKTLNIPIKIIRIKLIQKGINMEYYYASIVLILLNVPTFIISIFF